MTCTGAGGTAAASPVVTLNAKPSMTLSAAPAALTAGQATPLAFPTRRSSDRAAPWTASTAPSGSQSVSPTATTTYTMTCTGAGGTASASAIVTANAKTRITLTAAPAALTAGQATTLAWTTTNATACAAPWTAS